MLGLQRFWKRLWLEDSGQDLIEYSLLLAFVALCVVGLLTSVKASTSVIWSTLNVGLLSAQSAAS